LHGTVSCNISFAMLLIIDGERPSSCQRSSVTPCHCTSVTVH